MKGFLNSKGRHFPARLLSQRRLAFATVGVVSTLSFAPWGASALTNATIPLARMVEKSTFLSPMEPSKAVIIQFTLPLSDRQGARDLLKHVSTPKDPLYHHYITLPEFVTRFGANAADYATVRAWAVTNGLSIVHEATARTSLTLRGTVAQIQTLFKTQLNYYKTPSGEEFYSAGVAPAIPTELVPKIEALIGLTGGAQERASQYVIGKHLGEHPETPQERTQSAGGSGPGGSYSASDLRTAYSVPNFGGASAQTVAVFEDSSIAASDYEKYLTTNKLPNIKLTQIPVDQTTVGKRNGDEVEAILDIDMISAINPDVKEVQVYVAPAIVGPTIQEQEAQFSSDLIDVFDAVGKAFSASGQPQTLSVSYGLDEILMADSGNINGEADALTELGTMGVTVLASAGDHGAYGDTGLSNDPVTLNVMDPGSQPFVTCVGGTTLFTGTDGAYGLETVWNELGIYPGSGATGGGASSQWPISEPNSYDYQSSALVEYNGGNGSQRNVPDVAAIGDPETGVGIYVKDAGGWIQMGGTSVSAPIWAGYISIINAGAQYLFATEKPVIGFFNPLLYYSASFFGPNPNTSNPYPAGYLNSILEGSNGNANLYGVAGYTAGEYYNDCSGLGTIWGPYAFQAFWDASNQATADATPSGTPLPQVTISAKPTKTSAEISWTKLSGATGYAVYVQEYYFDLNTQTYVPYLYGQTHITRDTTINVKGLHPDSEVLDSKGETIPYLQYQVFVGAYRGSGSSLTGPYDFYTKQLAP